MVLIQFQVPLEAYCRGPLQSFQDRGLYRSPVGLAEDEAIEVPQPTAITHIHPLAVV